MDKNKLVLNFDLFQDKLKLNGFSNPLNAYELLSNQLENLKFIKRQQSSWISNNIIEMPKLIEKLDEICFNLSWLPDCVNHFTATAESGVLDLKPYLSEELSKEDFLDFENKKGIIESEKRAIHFDLSIKEIDKNFEYRSKPYYLINKEMNKQGFEHQQGSGYISKEALNSEEFIDKIYTICENIPKLKETLKHIDATYLKDVYDVTPFIKEMLHQDSFSNKISTSSLQKDVMNFTRDKLTKDEIISKSFFFQDKEYLIKDLMKVTGQHTADVIIQDCESQKLFLEHNFAGSNPFNMQLKQETNAKNFMQILQQKNDRAMSK